MYQSGLAFYRIPKSTREKFVQVGRRAIIVDAVVGVCECHHAEFAGTNTLTDQQVQQGGSVLEMNVL